MNDWECGWMNENLAMSKSHYVMLTKSLVIWKENKCHGMSVINICHMSFKMNLCGHLSWATLHIVANIYHINKDSIACCCAFRVNEKVITEKKLQCKIKKLGKSKSRKIRHWWGVADHQSAICHLCGWKCFLGGAWKCWQPKNCNTCIKQGSEVEVPRVTPYQIL